MEKNEVEDEEAEENVIGTQTLTAYNESIYVSVYKHYCREFGGHLSLLEGYKIILAHSEMSGSPALLS